jgi:RNA polymerase sigma-70 factor (family 1)
VPAPDISNQKDLLQRIAAGDTAAFTALFDAYKDRIYTIALRLTDSQHIAEEIVQDVFLRIWVKRENLAAVEHFRAYLFTATRNQVFNVLKRLGRHRRVTGELQADHAPEPADTDFLLLDKEYQAILREAIDQLPPQQQQVYRLMKEQGLKRDQVAEQLAISPQTVKAHLAQAMRSIRAFCVARLDLYIAFILFENLHK